MTLLVFALDNDSVVMGADGGLIEVAEQTPPAGFVGHAMAECFKPQRVGNLPIFWALCGDATENGPFARWFREEAALDDWDDLAECFGARIGLVNQQAIAKGEAAGEMAENVPRTVGLLIGNIDGRTDAIQAFPNGSTALGRQLARPYGFVGYFGPTARASWEVVSTFNPTLSLTNMNAMAQFMLALCGPMRALSEPVAVVRVPNDLTLECDVRRAKRPTEPVIESIDTTAQGTAE